MLSARDVRELLDYDEQSGVFKWIRNMGGSAKAGSVAGSIDSKGYRQIRVNGRLYLAHRLAWLYIKGEWPEGDLDHADRNPANNAIGNLRPCTHAQNHQNTGVRRDSSSGITGVSFVKSTGKWLAYITVNQETLRLGQYATKEEAAKVRAEAKAAHHTFGVERVEWTEPEMEKA